MTVNGAEFDWKAACVDGEEQYRLWSQHSTAMDHFIYSEGISASVDCVHLMKVCDFLALIVFFFKKVFSANKHTHLCGLSL